MQHSILTAIRAGLAAALILAAGALWAAEPLAGPPAPASVAAPSVTPVAEAEETSGGFDMSEFLGPDSNLVVDEEDGEIQMNIGSDGQFSSFRALKNVDLETQDFDLQCHELIYKPENGGLITADAASNGIVRIAMRSMSPGATGASQGNKGDTRATCGHYEYYVKEKIHILSINPVINSKDKAGKMTTIKGKKIKITQSATGGTNVTILGGTIGDKPRNPIIDKARRNAGLDEKSSVDIDMNNPTPVVVPTATGPARPVKIDEGNVGTLERPKPSRVLKLEEGQ